MNNSSRIPKVTNPDNEDLKKKVEQLCLSFDSINTACEFNFPSHKSLKKIYAPLDMGRYPFFLTSSTELVSKSRKGYAAYCLARKLESKGLTEKEVKSLITRQAKKLRAIGISDKEVNELSTRLALDFETNGISEKDIEELTKYETSPAALRFRTSSGWEILAHQNYGLPDSLDGYVWDYILSRMSLYYNMKGSFAFIYYINIASVINWLNDQGYYNSKGGALYQRVLDSLARLKHTSFKLKEGHYKKSSNEFLSEYTFTLITSIYQRGSRLPDGSIAYDLAVAIDPLLVHNLSSNYFLILLNSFRTKLKSMGAKVMFDRLSYLAFRSVVSEKRDFPVMLKYNFPFVIINNYNKLCEHFGFKMLKNSNLFGSHIYNQFKPIIDELITMGCLDKVYVATHGKGMPRFVFVLNREFVLDTLTLLNQSDYLDIYNHEPSIKEANDFFKKIRGFVRCPDILKELFENNSKVDSSEENFSPKVDEPKETSSVENVFEESIER